MGMMFGNLGSGVFEMQRSNVIVHQTWPVGNDVLFLQNKRTPAAREPNHEIHKQKIKQENQIINTQSKKQNMQTSIT